LEISAVLVKELRAKTDAGIMECKEALKNSSGDLNKAVVYLKEKGIAKADKKVNRTTKEGLVISYIHTNGKVGVLLELNCETDFVAKTEDFKNLGKEIAMQVAALSPAYVSREEVPQNITEQELEIYKKQARESGKKEEILEKIALGKMEKFYSEICLIDQPYMRDDKIKISDLIKQTVAKTGENITIKRFARFVVGAEEK